ncbi:MAG: hypothetical protein KY466_14375 [Gemmatimonadetes bacterium]|nr:hypothetical protein [Gemmatimonadota bacterium]
MYRTGCVLATAFLLTLGAATATAQEAAVVEESTAVAPDNDETNRAYVKGVLSREEVRTAARIAGADLDAAVDGVGSLDGERLERATRQARLVDRALGDAAQDRITLSATTIIIILLLLVVIIIAA